MTDQQHQANQAVAVLLRALAAELADAVFSRPEPATKNDVTVLVVAGRLSETAALFARTPRTGSPRGVWRPPLSEGGAGGVC